MTLRRFTLGLTVIAVVWAIVSFAAMTYGAPSNSPDNVHTDFGMPLAFATHTTSTIAGATDTWAVDTGALAADLAFWLVGVIAIMLINLARTLRTGPLTTQGMA